MAILKRLPRKAMTRDKHLCCSQRRAAREVEAEKMEYMKRKRRTLTGASMASIVLTDFAFSHALSLAKNC